MAAPQKDKWIQELGVLKIPEITIVGKAPKPGTKPKKFLSRAFQFYFEAVILPGGAGAAQESANFDIEVSQSGDQLDYVRGKKGQTSIRIETDMFDPDVDQIYVRIQGEAEHWTIGNSTNWAALEKSVVSLAVAKVIKVDPKKAGYTFSVKREVAHKEIQMTKKEATSASKKSIAAAKAGVGVEKVVAINVEASQSNEEESKSEHGKETTEKWTVYAYTGLLALTLT